MCANSLYKIGAWSGLVSESNGPENVYEWELLPMELWWEILKKVEVSRRSWPERRDFVAAAGVCRSWRQMCKEIVSPPELFASLTFPTSLKQRAPRNGRITCYIKANKWFTKFRLFLGDEYKKGKFLLVASSSMFSWMAHKMIISTDVEDSSCLWELTDVEDRSCLGELRSNREETEFSLYDDDDGSKVAKIVCDRTPPNELRPRVHCVMYSIPASVLEREGRVLGGDDDTTAARETGSIPASVLEREERVLGGDDDTTAARETGPFIMEFNPRAEENSSRQSVLRLGEMSERRTFEVSYGYPFCAVEAFAICVTFLLTDTLCALKAPFASLFS